MEFGDEDPGSSSSSSWLLGSRQRFNIELRPGETTIVSWKRLIKDAANNPSQQLEPPLTSPKSQDNHFQDDKLTTGHNGCNIENGSVENTESVSSADQKVKKRRKSTAKVVDNIEANLSNKHIKLDLNSAANVKLELPVNSHPLIAFSKKDSADTGIKLEYSSPVFLNSKDSEKPVTGTVTCGRESGNAVNLATELSNAICKNYLDESACELLEPQSKRLMVEMGGLEISINASREKTGNTELPDLNIPVEPVPPQPVKSVSMTSKDLSGLRPKRTMLERAIGELEQVVAELRPSNMDLNNFDTSLTAMKKRLPTEVKLKLAKVARLAQSSQGTISEELINHLMSILGHLVQLRTLKRNLREMVLRGLSAKREKADKFQQIKTEVVEIIKLQGLMPACASVIFTEAMEDKICDLYDLYVQGMDEEDKGPQIRKFYVELVELWPNGVMDKNQIKDAIRRAKERKRTLYDHQKVNENVRKKKSTLRTDIAYGEASSEADVASSDKMILSPPTNVGPSLNVNKEHELEKMTMPVVKKQIKQRQEELEANSKNSSMNESHKRHKPYTDDLSSQLSASPGNSGNK